jgi:hypothetical protein
MSQTFDAKRHVVELADKTEVCYAEFLVQVAAKKVQKAKEELLIVHKNVNNLKTATTTRLNQLAPLISKSADTVVYYREAVEAAEKAKEDSEDQLKKLEAACGTAKNIRDKAKLGRRQTEEKLHKKEVALHHEKNANGWEANLNLTAPRDEIQQLYQLFKTQKATQDEAEKAYKIAEDAHKKGDKSYCESKNNFEGLQRYSETVDATHDSLELIKTAWRNLGNVADDFHDKAALLERELKSVDGKGSEEKRVKAQTADLVELWNKLTGFLATGIKAEKEFVYYCSKGREPVKKGMFPAGAGEFGLLCSKHL